jgi:hypothetical protein
MDLLDQWRSPGEVMFAIVGPAGDGGRSGFAVSRSEVLILGPRGAPLATVPLAGPGTWEYIKPSDDGRHFAIATRHGDGPEHLRTIVRVYGPAGNQIATHTWRLGRDDDDPTFEVSGFDGTLAVISAYFRDPHLLLPNGGRVDFAPGEWIRNVDFVRDAPLVVTQRSDADAPSVTTMMDMQGGTVWEDADASTSPTFARSSPDGARVLVGGRGLVSPRFTTVVRLLSCDGELYRRERTGGWNNERRTHEYQVRSVAWSDDGGMVAVAYTDSVSVLKAGTGATAYDAPLPTDGFGSRMCIIEIVVNNRGVCAVLVGRYERLPGPGSVDDVADPEVILYNDRGQLLDRRKFPLPARVDEDRDAVPVQSSRSPRGPRRHDLGLGIGEAVLTVRIAADEYQLSLD